MFLIISYQPRQKIYFISPLNPISKVSLGISFLLLFIMTNPATAEQKKEKIIFQADTFSSVEAAIAAGWSCSSQREETCPRFSVDDVRSLGNTGSLGISGNSNNLSNGCWNIWGFSQ